MTRKSFAPTKLEALLDQFDRRCRMCRREIDNSTGLEWDHRIPLAIGGEDALSNLEPLCIRCHRVKTKADVTRIAKTARQRRRNLGIKKQKKKIPYLKAERRPSKPSLPFKQMFEEATHD